VPFYFFVCKYILKVRPYLLHIQGFRPLLKRNDSHGNFMFPLIKILCEFSKDNPYLLLLGMKSEGTITVVCIFCDDVHQYRALRHSSRLKYRSHNFWALLPLLLHSRFSTPQHSPIIAKILTSTSLPTSIILFRTTPNSRVPRSNQTTITISNHD
jgi:hypothetical protein